jgi:hypothetical protein
MRRERRCFQEISPGGICRHRAAAVSPGLVPDGPRRPAVRGRCTDCRSSRQLERSSNGRFGLIPRRRMPSAGTRCSSRGFRTERIHSNACWIDGASEAGPILSSFGSTASIARCIRAFRSALLFLGLQRGNDALPHRLHRRTVVGCLSGGCESERSGHSMRISAWLTSDHCSRESV